jgi:hypothetical protein
MRGWESGDMNSWRGDADSVFDALAKISITATIIFGRKVLKTLSN